MIIEYAKLFAQLLSFRRHFPSWAEVGQPYVTEYQAIIQSMEKTLGIDLNKFFLPDNTPHTIVGENIITSIGSPDWEVKYDSNIFLMKIDGLILFLSSLENLLIKEKEIGFQPDRGVDKH